MTAPIQTCTVCAAFGDKAVKPVLFCSMCGAWICDKCRPNMVRRSFAMLICALRDCGDRTPPQEAST